MSHFGEKKIIHYLNKQMAYVLCHKQLIDNGIVKLETTDDPTLVDCAECLRGLFKKSHIREHKD